MGIPSGPGPTLAKRERGGAGPSVPAITLLAALLAAGILAAGRNNTCPLSAGRVAPALSAAEEPTSPPPPPEPAFQDKSPVRDQDRAVSEAARKAVEKLIEEQKFEEAAAECARARAEARKSGDAALWAWSLIKEGRLRSALHGYETAVRFFKSEPWPESPLERDMLDLFYGQSLIDYYNAYSWEINERERVESREPLDLKSWTRDQIFAEAWDALLRVWKDRERLAGLKTADFPDFWRAGDYPAGVRDTLRDAVVYHLARLLADKSFWAPRRMDETWLVDLKGLLAEAGKTRSESAAAVLSSSSAHPVEKLAALLGEHETWSRRSGRSEAALEARFELVRALFNAFESGESRALIKRHLTAFLASSSNRKHAWWAAGQAQLADYVSTEEDPGALVRAREIALEGVKRFPDSPGGRRCLHVVRQIEAPDFDVEAMENDSPGRRSIRISHKNLDHLFFRAFALDAEALLKGAKGRLIFPQGEDARKAAESRRPDAEWRVDLDTRADYRQHFTYSPLPGDLKLGLYLLAASAKEDFAGQKNKVVGLGICVSDIVLLMRQDGEELGTRRVEVQAVSGSSGLPVPGAEVALFFPWWKGLEKLESRTTDGEGRAWFPVSEEPHGYFITARKGRDLAFSTEFFSFFRRRPEARETRASLIYTDRSVYRPGQKVRWKVLAYSGRRDLGRLSSAAGATVTVRLEDDNSEEVARASVVTNSFGTAGGEFVIPAAGRPLGSWSLLASPAGRARIRVEEYKRPTFEVSVKDPEKPLRLNRPAKLKLEARYYFGLPVAGGEVVWQVRREPVFNPRWWRRHPSGPSRVVAGGRAKTDDDGSCLVEFTPRAEETREGEAEGTSYLYSLSADVTDEGGETRSAERAFRLGFVGVEARVEAGSGFFPSGREASFTISRTDLDGTPRPGNGGWRVVRLIQPVGTLLPADQPLPPGPGPEDPAFPPTPGDRLRPRWESCASEDILAVWAEGPEVARGAVEHDASGRAAVSVPALPAGAYRFIYETKDDFGAAARDRLDFLVAGASGPELKLPLVVRAEKPSVPVGGTARLLVASGWAGQPVLFEIRSGGRLLESRRLEAGTDGSVIEVAVTEELRGGFSVSACAVRDHQFMSEAASVLVPWDNKELRISFATFRDRLAPGARETWKVTVKTPDGRPAEKGAAELLAYMYDRSLDLFETHRPPRVSALYADRTGASLWKAALGTAWTLFESDRGWRKIPASPAFREDRLLSISGYGIGGPGSLSFIGIEGGVVSGVLGGVVGEADATVEAEAPRSVAAKTLTPEIREEITVNEELSLVRPGPPSAPRSDFAETAFWQPHLLTGDDGTAAIEFTVPDSVTSWRVFVHAVTRDLEAGSLEAEAKTVKELMVRPYLPRFLREGDSAELRVVVNNAGGRELAGEVALEVTDPLTGGNLAPAFGLPESVPTRPFTVKPGAGTTVSFPLTAPARVGTAAFKVMARSGDLSDGELRPLPVLPGRMHLVQSRFAALKEGKPRELVFEDMARAGDPTLLNEQLVVTVDAQLFYGLLEALPYLVNYPYECTEQTLNRFLATGILTSLYSKYPQVERLARELSKRETAYEAFGAADPNRKMSLEETPWLDAARGGTDAGEDLAKVLDPRAAAAQKQASLEKLLGAELASGAFPWWPGGPPSPYMTLYIVHGFSKALEFGAEVPKGPVARALKYLHGRYLDDMTAGLMARDTGWEFVTFLNYVLSNFPSQDWTEGSFTAADRARMLDFCFKHWKEHSPYLKGFLALTLKRAGRTKDAALVWDSVMDSARTTEDEGTSWAPEDHAWLWYNDTIESQAFALRTLLELDPADRRSEGLVQWLFLNKKLNHWKSTRATAEVLYSVAWFLKETGGLAVRESVTAEACGLKASFVFEPDRYTGKKNRLVITGDKLGPDCAKVRLTKTGRGPAFASAAWHFSTDRLPEKSEGDLFAVDRAYYKREKRGGEVVLKPLGEGAPLAVGDEIEVRLSVRARHQAEYVHLRDPRPAGCEPVTLRSGYKWELGLARYEEVRDSGTNFFIEWLPQGEYTLSHRLRCATAGVFKAAPATLQSMYAPEFAAYSTGAVIAIR